MPVADEPAKESLTAHQILKRTEELYGVLETYRDTGVSTTEFKGVALLIIPIGRTSRLTFSTAFDRRGRFRFEYVDTEMGGMPMRYLVWRNGPEVKTWWDLLNRLETSGDLGLAVAGATGVSGGTAHLIPALLMPEEIGGSRLTHAQQAERIENGVDRGVECFRVKVTSHGDDVVWIDSNTFLIRRIDESRKFDTFTTAQTILYDPEPEIVLEEADLAFDPPAEPRKLGLLEQLFIPRVNAKLDKR